MNAGELREALRRGEWFGSLRDVYAPEDAQTVCRRLLSVVDGYEATFGVTDEDDLLLFSVPGRTEMGGNHTDHQGGTALGASVDLDTLACVARCAEKRVRIQSAGHRMAVIELSELTRREEEKSRSSALVRGICARITQMGYELGGFNAYTETRVLRGSGLSSSAAFEVMVGLIASTLFCRSQLSATQLAQIGQYAENVYYGKPCGLLDQLACASGGVVAADFSDPAQPKTDRVRLDLRDYGYALCIIDSGASHSDLDEEYAAIPADMEKVAAFFGKKKLQEVGEKEFWARMDAVNAACGSRATDRARHFFDENARAKRQLRAVADGRFAEYLALVRASGASSRDLLRNVATEREDDEHRLAQVIARAEQLAQPSGAARVHGGGFAGTAQAYIPLDELDRFIARMEELTGKGSCHVVRIRDAGASVLVQ